MRIQAEANLSALIESTEDLIWSVDPRYRLITFNRAFKEHIERSYGGPVAPGMSLSELLPPAHAVHWPPLYQRALSGAKFRVEFPLADGRTLDLSFSPILVDGETTGVSVFGKDVTGRKAAESAIKKAEADLLALIESTQDLIWSVDLDYRLTAFNEALRQNIEETFGVRLAAGMRHHELLPPERAVLWPPYYARALAEGPFRMEYSLILPRILELAFNPIIVDGKATGVSVFGKDITERKQATEALAESEARFRTFFEQNGSVMILVEPSSGEIVAANRAASAFYGYAQNQLIGMNVSQINTLPPEEVARERQRALSDERNFFLFRHRLASGEEREVEVYSSPVEVEGRRRLFSIVHDVTEHRQWETQLRDSEERFRATFEQAAVGIVHLSFEGRILRCNARFAHIVGYPTEEVSGLTVLQITVPEDAAESAAVIRRIMNGGGAETIEKRYLRKDGSLSWAKTTVSVQRDSQGRPLHLIAFIEDINERKQAEIMLRDSEERYHSTFEQAAVGIVHASFEGRYLRCNAHFAGLLGYTADEIPGLTIQQITAPENFAANIEALQRIRNGASVTETYEKRYIRKDGSLTWAKLTISLQRDGEGRALNFIALVEDINARKAAEERLAAIANELRSSEERYRTAFQTSIDAFTLSQLEDGRFVDVNQAFLRLFGYEREEVVGRTSLELNIWSDPRDRLNMVKALRKNSVCRDMEFQLNKKNGQSFSVLVSGARIELDGIPSLLLVVRDLTAVKAAERRLTEAQEALRVSEERHRLAFQTSPNAVTIARLDDGLLLDVNETFLEITGFKREEVTGRTARELNIWADRSDLKNMVETLRREMVFRGEVQLRKKSGEIIWGRMSASVFKHEGVSSVLTVTQNISEAKAAEQHLAAASEALRLSEHRYRTAFQTSLDAISICQMEDGRFVDVNEAYLKLYGYKREELLGRTSPEMKLWVDNRDRQTMVDIVRQNSSFRSSEVQFRKKNGEVVWGEMSASEIQINGVPCILTVTRDISSAKAAENTIRDLAFYDPLTGLPNRRLLLERLRQTLGADGRSGRSQALLFVELDNFKTLNETLGHQTGDLMLQEVARRIVACAQEADTVGRLGGDEFVVMLEDLSESAEEAALQAEAVGEKILASISLPFQIEDHECLTTASIGIVVFKDQREGTDELMQRADIALYEAKAAGRNTIRFFSPALQAAVNARATLEEDLRQAIKTKQFLLYYQPQISRGRLTGAEALIRWQHPRNGMVPPDEFIPLAEETGLILPLGEWVLETACAQIAAWAGRKKTGHISLAVNISALQFRQAGFVETVLAALQRTGANPANLKLELTESMLVENIDEVIAKMEELKSHGLSFSLDDFGTGYSSLAYLKRLPLDQLKIDRVFVRDMLVDVTSGAIAQTIISLGRAMGLSVIAEGVETEQQRGFLAGLGCHTFQGTLFSPPLALEEFEAFL